VSLVSVPPEPTPYSDTDGLTADAISRYNTGTRRNLFYFDYHYVVSANNLHVITEGTPEWVLSDGHWQSNSQWQAIGGIHTARRWRVNTSCDESYVPHVLDCDPPE
jgi:hypothetical protein